MSQYLIRDNDNKFGASFTRVAVGSGIKALRTPYKAPKANAFCERFLGSVRRECLDHMLILGERHLHGVVKEYVRYFNEARPHQGISQAIPLPVPVRIPQIVELQEAQPRLHDGEGKVITVSVLRGLHHDYRRVA